MSLSPGTRLGLVVVVVAVVGLATWVALGPARRAPSGEASDPRVVVTPIPDPYPEYPDTALEARLRVIVGGARASCGIMAKHLGNGAIARVNPDMRIPLLSVVKLPVSIVVLDGVDQGRWSLGTPITLLAQDMHPRGALGDRFPRGGGPVSLYELLDVMIRESDNTSADALMRSRRRSARRHRMAGAPRHRWPSRRPHRTWSRQ